MVFPITNASAQTLYFELALVLLVLIFLKKKPASWVLSSEVSTLLKGASILAIIFAHIGYYLVSDTKFLYPLSIAAGIGVNIFLFISGYGLTRSAVKNTLSRLDFYKKRLLRLYVPLFLTLLILLALDGLFLHLFYPLKTVLQSFIGFFPKANLYADINSPLWYFTLILGFYLIFPIIFFKRAPVISGFLALVIAYFVTTRLTLPVEEGVLGLYRLHILAFPLGMIYAGLTEIILQHQTNHPSFWNKLPRIPKLLSTFIRYAVMAMSLYYTQHFLIESGVGKGLKTEQIISLGTMALVILLALCTKLSSRFLLIFGTYSYEIYLLHWPFFYRYSPLFLWLPPAAATALSLALLLPLAFLLQKIAGRLTTFIAPEFSKK